MAWSYVTQEAGWALDVEAFGEIHDPGSHTWTISTTGAFGNFEWYMYGEAGNQVGLIGNTSPPSPYSYAWGDGLGIGGLLGMRVTRMVVSDPGLGNLVRLEATMDDANTGDLLLPAVAPFTTTCLGFWSATKQDGRDQAADGTLLYYLRDLSGYENFVTVQETWYIAHPATPAVAATDGGEGIVTFGANECMQGDYLAATSQEWTVVVRAKFDATGVAHDLFSTLTSGGQCDVELAIDSAGKPYARAYNTLGSSFLPTAASAVDATQWHDYAVRRSTTDIEVLVDGVQVATLPCSGTSRTSSGAPGVNVGPQNARTAGSYRHVGWFGSALTDEELEIATAGISAAVPVNIAPAPGGVLTATASPRGRVRIGMSVSPDGGAP